jgi:hypothetical protein
MKGVKGGKREDVGEVGEGRPGGRDSSSEGAFRRLMALCKAEDGVREGAWEMK